MTTSTQWLLIALGIGVCGVLLWYIAGRLKLLRRRRQEQERKDEVARQRRADAIQSVQVLAMAIEQGQVSLSEGAIRIHGLLQVLAPELLDQQPYSVFRLIAEQTAHMPTHERRAETDKRFLRKMDHERHGLEADHEQQILEAASAIRRFDFKT